MNKSLLIALFSFISYFSFSQTTPTIPTYPTTNRLKFGYQTEVNGLIWRTSQTPPYTYNPTSFTPSGYYFILDETTGILYNYRGGAWKQLGLNLSDASISGTLPVARGGTGAEAFTQGSVVFAGASGVYSQNNARLFWNNSTNRLGINTSNPQAALHLEGGGEAMRFRAATASSAPFMSFYASDSVDASNAGILYRSFETNTNRYYLTYYGGTNSDGYQNAFTLFQFTSRANVNISRVRMLFSDNGDFAVGKISSGSTLAGSTFVVKDGGNVGVGVAAPTAALHLKAGTGSANTSPLKFTSGTNLTTPEAGAMEFNGANLFFTPSTTRNIIPQISGETPLASGRIIHTTTSGFLTSYPSRLDGAIQLVAIGSNPVNTTGFYNFFLGPSAGQSTTTGANNVFVGQSAGQNNTTGSGNNFFGEGAGQINTTGVGNNYFGQNAGIASNGSYNSFIGTDAGRTSTGSNNTYIGYQAGRLTGSGASNVFIGVNAGNYSTDGDRLSGNFNTIIGPNSGTNIRGGASGNLVIAATNLPVASGSNQINIKDLIYATGASGSGNGNVGIGIAPTKKLEVYGDLANGDGIQLTDASNGYMRIAQSTANVGVFAGMLSGQAIGDNPSFNLRGVQTATTPRTTATLQLQVANSSEANAIANTDKAITFLNWSTEMVTVLGNGNFGIGATNPAYKLDVNGNFRADSIFTDIAGNAVFSTSDARLKKNIEPVPSMLQKITALNPVTYEWNDLKVDQAINRDNTAHLYGKKIGLIAQEVYEVFPDFVGTDADGNMVLSYGAFIVPMLKAIQEQQAQIEALKQRITQLENK